MKKSIFSLLVLISLHSFAQDAAADYKKLQSIEGNWSMQTKRGITYESWVKINDSVLAGKSYRLINTMDTLLLEEVLLVRKGSNIFYIPVVQGQNDLLPVTFKLISTEKDVFVFDNPQHDFPQKINYELPKNGNLHAWIEGMDKGSYRKSDFYYKKVK
jgi:hypothetical protein